ncbi:MAG: GTP-dependent dephospho-CoA kinase family protein, partial [Aigarchaeota archaeon]|nr:GTP-dependent dephospho-CoA kinase family protein [Aigarchaeota archaeon]
VIGDLRPVKTIVIGDRSSSFMRGHRLHSDIYVVDGKVERVAIEDFVVEGASEIRVSNPAGRITREAWRALREALRRKSPVVVRVCGEEDLLTIAAVEAAPKGSLVLYGQPGEGLVAVEVTAEKKKELRELLRGLVH